MHKKIYIPIIIITGILAAAFFLYLPNAKNYFTSVVSTDTDAETKVAAFSDVNSSNQFFDAVNFVKSQNFVNGYDDGTYKPSSQINRAEFVKIIIGAIFTENEISQCTPTKTFSDVNENDWFYKYVCTASNNGIVGGYADGSFKPANYINFSEASKIIVNAFGYQTSPSELWYQSFIEKLEELKAIPTTICSVSKNISRGEMAEMIYRLKEKITNKSSRNFFTGDVKTVASTTFVKSYRLKENSDTFGIVETSDGGYALTGNTWTPTELCGYSMFFIKTDNSGDKQWNKLFHNCSSEGYAITQLTDGNLVAAGQVSGEFRTDEEQAELEGQGDNFLVKLDNNGNNIWTRTVSQQSTDRPAKLLPTSNGGFTMSGSTGTLVGQFDVADIQDVLELGNFDADGETNWFKKIEGDENMMTSANKTKDGGYIMIANVKLVEENDQKVPALVKLKSNGTFDWATGLENLPIEIPNLIINPDGKTFTVGTPNKMHLAFGQFMNAEQTDDGGYIALGSYFSAISTAEINKGVENAFGQSKFVGVKVDSKGKLQWARTINIKKFLEESVMKKTSDGGYIIMGNNYVGGYINEDAMAQAKIYEQMMEDYYAKYPVMSEETPESKKALDEISAEIESWQSGLGVRNITLVKLDKNFNYQWGKNIGGTKDLDGYDIIQTSDSGYAITGTWHTGIKRKVLTSILEYTEAMIMKLDLNGNLGNDNGLVADFSDIELSDVSVYVVANKLSSPELVIEYPMENVVRTINLTNKDGVKTIGSETATYQAQICSETTNTLTVTGGTTTPTTKTRAQMKYDETVAIEAKTTKGILVNDEISPILKEVFTDVKLWDDDVSGWVAYRFSRLVTETDINKVITKLEALGYGIDSNANKDFTATKIGLTLNFHFYLGDTNTGRLDVMY
ncbi:S-layer homology domain-containing protein [Candidatus Gracilibacteria bacterium]|nr:S-layer homology domain-containing protein [Candidatus Gracilibacteria bacterium]